MSEISAFECNGHLFEAFAEGRVVATLVNPCMSREDHKRNLPPAIAKPFITVSVRNGVWGDYHAGPRRSDKRELSTCGIEPGSHVMEWRQFSAVSVEQSAEMAAILDLEGIPFGALGENLVISGIDGLTQLPATSLLHFFAPDGAKRDAILAVWGENRACGYPGGVLRRWHYPDRKDLPQAFAALASLKPGLRGIVGLVFSTGHKRSARIHTGDTVKVQRFEPR